MSSDLFHTLGDADWKRAIRESRARRKIRAREIAAKIAAAERAAVCENCRFWSVACKEHPSTCALKRRQVYTYPTELGAAHGWAPVTPGCFELRSPSAPMFAPRRGRLPAESTAPGMAAAKRRRKGRA